MTDINDAIQTEHVAFFENWSPGYAMTVKTRWFNTKKEADTQANKYRAEGADLSRVMSERSNILGKYRVIGHFPVENP